MIQMSTLLFPRLAGLKMLEVSLVQPYRLPSIFGNNDHY